MPCGEHTVTYHCSGVVVPLGARHLLCARCVSKMVASGARACMSMRNRLCGSAPTAPHSAARPGQRCPWRQCRRDSLDGGLRKRVEGGQKGAGRGGGQRELGADEGDQREIRERTLQRSRQTQLRVVAAAVPRQRWVQPRSPAAAPRPDSSDISVRRTRCPNGERIAARPPGAPGRCMRAGMHACERARISAPPAHGTTASKACIRAHTEHPHASPRERFASDSQA